MKNILICPVCGEILIKKDKSFVCINGHNFDISKEGYVNLTSNNKCKQSGDNRDMIKARQRTMEKGYYRKLISALVNVLKSLSFEVFLDAGAGTGYIAGEIKKEFPSSTVIATDLSKAAVSLGAKRNKDVLFAVAKSNALPLAKNSVDVVFSAFAPCFYDEFSRVLSCGGIFISVTPDINHLYDLKAKLYKTPELNDATEEKIEGFKLLKSLTIKDCFSAEKNEILNLILMTPYYYRTNKEDILRLTEQEKIETNLEFLIRIYKKEN